MVKTDLNMSPSSPGVDEACRGYMRLVEELKESLGCETEADVAEAVWDVDDSHPCVDLIEQWWSTLIAESKGDLNDKLRALRDQSDARELTAIRAKRRLIPPSR